MSDVPDFRSLKQEAEMRRGGVVKRLWSAQPGVGVMVWCSGVKEGEGEEGLRRASHSPRKILD